MTWDRRVGKQRTIKFQTRESRLRVNIILKDSKPKMSEIDIPVKLDVRRANSNQS